MLFRSEIVAMDSLNTNIAQGEVGQVGTIHIPLTTIKQSASLDLLLQTGESINRYQIWVYPDEIESESDFYLASSLDEKVKERLACGESVSLIPDTAIVKEKTVGPLFTPDYWNYSMFKSISENAKREVSPGTLSILTSPEHPLFNSFPTEMHSNWQWWPLIHCSHPLILDDTAPDYKPLVQVIDNMARCHKLGLIFEYQVGEGKLLVS